MNYINEKKVSPLVVAIIVFVLLLAAVGGILFALLPFCLLGLLRLVLRRLILRVLRLRVGIAAIATVFMTMTVAPSSAAVTTLFIAVFYGGVIFFIFFHKIIST